MPCVGCSLSANCTFGENNLIKLEKEKCQKKHKNADAMANFMKLLHCSIKMTCHLDIFIYISLYLASKLETRAVEHITNVLEE